MSRLYQQLILDHNKNPKNYGDFKKPTHKSVGVNPLCGDSLHVELRIKDNRITGIRFTSEGCAIAKASASIMTQILKGKTVTQAYELILDFDKFLQGGPASDKKLETFRGIMQYSSRTKCARLSWQTAYAALAQLTEITTENIED